MRIFRKVAFSTILFLSVLAITAGIILVPWKNSESGYYMDSRLRESLAGNIDFIVIGASHGLAAFIPEIIDEELDCYSYNLCGSMMPMYSRTYMLQKELERNPVKTVVLEMSFNALARTHEREYGDGESVTLLRLDSFPERLSYMVRFVDFDDWLNIFCRDMISALSYWKSILLHNESHIDYEAKGYKSNESVNRSLEDDIILSTYNSSKAIGDFTSENLEQFYQLIKLCKDNNCEIYVVSTPISDSCIWRSDDWDTFYNTMKQICAEQEISWFDFNLLKERYNLFSDSASFYDAAHLSNYGAESFTYSFTEVVNRFRSGEDVSGLFYSSYAEMKTDSPYMEYYLAHK